MIFATCIYCDELKLWEIGDTAGRWAHITCDACRRPQWLYISRLNPYSLTEDAFNAKYYIDGRTIFERNPPPPLSRAAEIVLKTVNRVMSQIIADEIIGVVPAEPSEEMQRKWRSLIDDLRNNEKDTSDD